MRGKNALGRIVSGRVASAVRYLAISASKKRCLVAASSTTRTRPKATTLTYDTVESHSKRP